MKGDRNAWALPVSAYTSAVAYRRDLLEQAVLDGATVFFFQAEDGIRVIGVTGVQTCALPISKRRPRRPYQRPEISIRSSAARSKRSSSKSTSEDAAPGTLVCVAMTLQGTPSARRGRLLQLPSQLADLVAELRGVLEAQLLRGREHLLLELHDRRFQLRWSHVGLPLAPPPPPGRHLGIAHQELRDVGDPLDDR